MAQLYVNHSMLAGSPEKTAEVVREASELLESVEKESGDAKLAKEALSLRAYCYLMLGDPCAAIDLLDDSDEQALAPGPVLAKAYILKGDRDRAISILQRHIFHSIIGAFAAVPDLMTLYADDPDKMEAWLRLALEGRGRRQPAAGPAASLLYAVSGGRGAFRLRQASPTGRLICWRYIPISRPTGRRIP